MASNITLTPEQLRDKFHSTDDLVWGSLFVVTSVLEIIIYVPCMIVIKTDKELWKNPCYKIMFQLGFVDFGSIFSEIIAGILSITGWSFTIPYWLNKIIASLSTSGFCWYAYIALIHLLAFNRCVGVAFAPYWNKRLFAVKKIYFWIGLCYFYASIWTALWLSPWAGMIYYPETFTYYFDFTRGQPLVSVLSAINFWNCVVILGGVFIWYGIIVVKLGTMRRSVSSTSDQIREKEMKTLKLAAVICGFIIINDQYWHNIGPFLFDMGFPWALAAGNYFNTINGGFNPVVYITMNKTINRKVRLLLGLNAAQVGTTTTHGGRSVSAAKNPSVNPPNHRSASALNKTGRELTPT